MELINEILKWPVIIQGALGSFLFWLIFTLTQKASSSLISKLKGEKEVGKFFAKSAHDAFYEKLYDASNYAFFVSIYAALHYFLKFVLALFIALLVSNLIPVFGYIGYLFGAYFLFRSMSYVPHFATFELKNNKNSKS